MDLPQTLPTNEETDTHTSESKSYTPRLVPLVPLLVISNLVTLFVAGGLWLQNRDLQSRLASRDIQPVLSTPQPIATKTPTYLQESEIEKTVLPEELAQFFALESIQSLLVPDNKWQSIASSSATLGDKGLEVTLNGSYDSITLPGKVWKRSTVVNEGTQMMKVEIDPTLRDSEGWQMSYRTANASFQPSFADGVYGSRAGYLRVQSGYLQLYLYEYAPESPVYVPNPEGGPPGIKFPYTRSESIFISDPVAIESLLQ